MARTIVVVRGPVRLSLYDVCFDFVLVQEVVDSECLAKIFRALEDGCPFTNHLDIGLQLSARGNSLLKVKDDLLEAPKSFENMEMLKVVSERSDEWKKIVSAIHAVLKCIEL